VERVARIELANKPWQGFRLPLHHTRIKILVESTKSFGQQQLNLATRGLQSRSIGLANVECHLLTRISHAVNTDSSSLAGVRFITPQSLKASDLL
jgi:hypothetical protein